MRKFGVRCHLKRRAREGRLHHLKEGLKLCHSRFHTFFWMLVGWFEALLHMPAPYVGRQSSKYLTSPNDGDTLPYVLFRVFFLLFIIYILGQQRSVPRQITNLTSIHEIRRWLYQNILCRNVFFSSSLNVIYF